MSFIRGEETSLFTVRYGCILSRNVGAIQRTPAVFRVSAWKLHHTFTFTSPFLNPIAAKLDSYFKLCCRLPCVRRKVDVIIFSKYSF